MKYESRNYAKDFNRKGLPPASENRSQLWFNDPLDVPGGLQWLWIWSEGTCTKSKYRIYVLMSVTDREMGFRGNAEGTMVKEAA